MTRFIKEMASLTLGVMGPKMTQWSPLFQQVKSPTLLHACLPYPPLPPLSSYFSRKAHLSPSFSSFHSSSPS